MLPSSRIPKSLTYFVNSIPTPACALFENLGDLHDGIVYDNLVCSLYEISEIPHLLECNSSASRVRSIICYLALKNGWESFPDNLKDNDSAEKIASGKDGLDLLLLLYIVDLHKKKAKSKKMVAQNLQYSSQADNEKVSNDFLSSKSIISGSSIPKSGSNLAKSDMPISKKNSVTFTKNIEILDRASRKSHPGTISSKKSHSTTLGGRKTLNHINHGSLNISPPLPPSSTIPNTTLKKLQENKEGNTISGQLNRPMNSAQLENQQLHGVRNVIKKPSIVPQFTDVVCNLSTTANSSIGNKKNQILTSSVTSKTCRRRTRSISPKSTKNIIGLQSQSSKSPKNDVLFSDVNEFIITASLQVPSQSKITSTIDASLIDWLHQLGVNTNNYFIYPMSSTARPPITNNISSITMHYNNAHNRSSSPSSRTQTLQYQWHSEDFWGNGLLLSQLVASLCRHHKEAVKEVMLPEFSSLSETNGIHTLPYNHPSWSRWSSTSSSSPFVTVPVTSHPFDGVRNNKNRTVKQPRKVLRLLLLTSTEFPVTCKPQALHNIRISLNQLKKLFPLASCLAPPPAPESLLGLKGREALLLLLYGIRSIVRQNTSLIRSTLSKRKGRPSSAPPLLTTQEKSLRFSSNMSIASCPKENPIINEKSTNDQVFTRNQSHRQVSAMTTGANSSLHPPRSVGSNTSHFNLLENGADRTTNGSQSSMKISKDIKETKVNPNEHQLLPTTTSSPINNSTSTTTEIISSQVERVPHGTTKTINNNNNKNDDDNDIVNQQEQEITNSHRKLTSVTKVEPLIKGLSEIKDNKKIKSIKLRRKNPLPKFEYTINSMEDSNTSAIPIPVAPITTTQQLTIRKWLQSFGLFLRDGEGGILPPPSYEYTTAYTPPSNTTNSSSTLSKSQSQFIPLPLPPSLPIPLHDDRLRNGLMLYRLLQLLEPEAISHLQPTPILMKAISVPVLKSNASVTEIMQFISSLFLVLKIKKCPPLPSVYLTYAERVVRGESDYIWGLFWELKEVYLDTPNALSVSRQWHQSQEDLSEWLSQRVLFYDPRTTVTADQPHKMNNNINMIIIKLELQLRNGSLFFQLVNYMIARSSKGQSRLTLPSSTAVKNISYYINHFKSRSFIDASCLYNGVEEDIARGDWEAALIILRELYKKDIHKLSLQSYSVTADSHNQNKVINSHKSFSNNYFSSRTNNNSNFRHLDRESLNMGPLKENSVNNEFIGDNVYKEPNIIHYDFRNPNLNNNNQEVVSRLPSMNLLSGEEANNRQQKQLKQKLDNRISELLGGIHVDSKNDSDFEDADDLLDRL